MRSVAFVFSVMNFAFIIKENKKKPHWGVRDVASVRTSGSAIKFCKILFYQKKKSAELCKAYAKDCRTSENDLDPI